MSWQNSTPLMELGHRSAVTLVRNEDSKLLAVRRTVNAAQAEIYRVLQGVARPAFAAHIRDRTDGERQLCGV